MKLFVAGLGTETNSFSMTTTRLADFEQFVLLRPASQVSEPTEYTSLLWAAQNKAADEDINVCIGTFAHACPGGITTRETYEQLRDEILDQLKAVAPVDAVALSMHGAMVAEGYEDCEGDMLAHVRELVGPSTPIGAVLDPHCHLTERMVRQATLIITFKEYPHTDYVERSQELLDLLLAAGRKQIAPHMSVFDCHMIDAFHTTREPMQSFIRKIKSLEKDEPVLSISVIHSFPWGNVSDLGARILVITNNAPETGARIASELGHELFSFRGRTRKIPTNLDDALDQACSSSRLPVVIADTADNPGGGAPGDATFCLSAVLDRGLTGVCIGPLYDPETVAAAFEKGPGGALKGKIGGFSGRMSGKPVQYSGKVIGLRRSAMQKLAGRPSPMGDAAAIEFDGVQIVVTSARCQGLSPDLFRVVGIEPTSARILIVKSSHHFYDAFSSLAGEVIYAETEGLLNMKCIAVAYTRLGERKLWPIHDIDEHELQDQPFWPSGDPLRSTWIGVDE